MKSGCATALVLNKWDLTSGDDFDLDHERARVNRKLRLRPKVLTTSAKTGRDINRILIEALSLADARSTGSRRQSSTASSATAASRETPQKQGRRLKLFYAAQIETRAPRFLDRRQPPQSADADHAYFVENRLRERYALEGIPLVIDFVELPAAPAGGDQPRAPGGVRGPAVAIMGIVSFTACGPTRAGRRRRRAVAGLGARLRAARPDPADPAARRLGGLAPKLPGYGAARDAALKAVSPTAGAFDLERDAPPVAGRPGGCRARRPRRRALRVAGDRERPRRAQGRGARWSASAARARDALSATRSCGGFGGNAAAFRVSGFLVAGPELAVERSIDVARGDAPPLAEASAFERAVAGARAVGGSSTWPPRGLRVVNGGVAGTIAALLDQPGLRAVGAAAERPTAAGCGSARAASAPASRAAPVSARSPPACRPARSRCSPRPTRARRPPPPRGWAAPACSSRVRSVLGSEASLNADHDLVGRPRGLHGVDRDRRAAPVIGSSAAHPTTPRACARSRPRRGPGRRALAEVPDAPGAFDSKEVAGVDAFTLRVSDGFEPTYAISGDASSRPRTACGGRLPHARAAPV